MKQLTDDQTYTALKCCSHGCDCKGCPLQGNGFCGRILLKHVFDLVSRQKAEIKRCERYKFVIKMLEKDIEEYRRINGKCECHGE